MYARDGIPGVGPLGAALVVAATGRAAWAQGSATSPAAPASGGGGTFVAIALVVALLVVVGVIVKLFDLRRRREGEAVHLQAQISDALLRDQSLFGLPITPEAHIPLWSGTPATVTVAGQVPGHELHQHVLRTVEQEALRLRSDIRIEDRLTVTAEAPSRVA